MILNFPSAAMTSGIPYPLSCLDAERAEVAAKPDQIGSLSAVGRHDLPCDRRFLGGTNTTGLPKVPRGTCGAAVGLSNPSLTQEHSMPMFMMSLNWTDQGIRGVKDSPKRAQAAKELAKKVGVDIKQVYLTSG